MNTQDELGSLVDVSFTDGGHMVAWAVSLRQALRLVEQLLLGARAEVSAGLTHQRWRILRGELPPRVRAIAVTVHLTMLIASVRAAMLAVDGFKTALVGMVIEPARAAAAARAEAEADRDRDAGASSWDDDADLGDLDDGQRVNGMRTVVVVTGDE